MSEPKEKSIPLAIGLNFLLPGLGYMYMGKIIIGIATFFLILGIYLTMALAGVFFAWITLNVIMAIDMLILGNKNKKTIEEKTTMNCPQCAELIKKEAKVCKHCKSDISPSAA